MRVDTNPDDNTASAAISTVPWAETSITKTFSPAQPVAGGPVTYTLTMHNDGPGTVDMVAADLLPAALQNPTASISGGTGNCQFDPTGRRASGWRFPIVSCEVPQFGPERGSRDHDPWNAGGRQRGHASGQHRAHRARPCRSPAFSFEPDFSNNDAEVSFTPGTVDVGITKSLIGPSTVSVGDTASFRLVASNSGTVAAQNVVVTDTLPRRTGAGRSPGRLPGHRQNRQVRAG